MHSVFFEPAPTLLKQMENASAPLWLDRVDMSTRRPRIRGKQFILLFRALAITTALRIGSRVKIKGTAQADGSVAASRIKVKR